jgi:hypothetical protein
VWTSGCINKSASAWRTKAAAHELFVGSVRNQPGFSPDMRSASLEQSQG